MQSTMKVELFSSGVNAWPTCYLSARFLVLLLPTKSVQTQEMPCRLPKVPLSRQTFWVAQGKRLLIRTPQGRMFPGLIEFCGQGYLPIIRAEPAHLKFLLAIRTSCCSGMSCFNANLQVSISVYSTQSKVSFNSDVMLIGTSALRNL